MSIRRRSRLLVSFLIALEPLAVGGTVALPVQSAEASTVKCPAPIVKWVFTLRSGVHDGVFPGQTFDVAVPKKWAQSAVNMTFSNHGVVREVCSQLGSGGKQIVLFAAVTVGTSEVSVSLKDQSTSVLHDQITVNPAPPMTPWPKSFTAHVMTPLKGYSKPVKFGSLVTGSNYIQRSTISLKDQYGYALAYVNSFQYAARTVDGGKTWRVASTWFAGPWADSAAFAGTIKTFSPTIAAAAGDGQLLYTTTDAGKRWYGLFFSGIVLNVKGNGAHGFTVALGTEDGVGMGRSYVSGDGGLHWTLT